MPRSTDLPEDLFLEFAPLLITFWRRALRGHAPPLPEIVSGDEALAYERQHGEPHADERLDLLIDVLTAMHNRQVDTRALLVPLFEVYSEAHVRAWYEWMNRRQEVTARRSRSALRNLRQGALTAIALHLQFAKSYGAHKTVKLIPGEPPEFQVVEGPSPLDQIMKAEDRRASLSAYIAAWRTAKDDALLRLFIEDDRFGPQRRGKPVAIYAARLRKALAPLGVKAGGRKHGNDDEVNALLRAMGLLPLKTNATVRRSHQTCQAKSSATRGRID